MKYLAGIPHQQRNPQPHPAQSQAHHFCVKIYDLELKLFVSPQLLPDLFSPSLWFFAPHSLWPIHRC